MNYELEKKLKDAGFPQKIVNGINHGESRPPTLSELIDAFGDDFNFVCRNKDTGLWGAETHSGVVVTKSLTPVEAVARLWLAFNKK